MLFGMGMAHITLETKDVSTMGASKDMAYERGYYTLTHAHPTEGIIDNGK